MSAIQPEPDDFNSIDYVVDYAALAFLRNQRALRQVGLRQYTADVIKFTRQLEAYLEERHIIISDAQPFAVDTRDSNSSASHSNAYNSASVVDTGLVGSPALSTQAPQPQPSWHANVNSARYPSPSIMYATSATTRTASGITSPVHATRDSGAVSQPPQPPAIATIFSSSSTSTPHVHLDKRVVSPSAEEAAAGSTVMGTAAMSSSVRISPPSGSLRNATPVTGSVLWSTPTVQRQSSNGVGASSSTSNGVLSAPSRSRTPTPAVYQGATLPGDFPALSDARAVLSPPTSVITHSPNASVWSPECFGPMMKSLSEPFSTSMSSHLLMHTCQSPSNPSLPRRGSAPVDTAASAKVGKEAAPAASAVTGVTHTAGAAVHPASPHNALTMSNSHLDDERQQLFVTADLPDARLPAVLPVIADAYESGPFVGVSGGRRASPPGALGTRLFGLKSTAPRETRDSVVKSPISAANVRNSNSGTPALLSPVQSGPHYTTSPHASRQSPPIGNQVNQVNDADVVLDADPVLATLRNLFWRQNGTAGPSSVESRATGSGARPRQTRQVLPPPTWREETRSVSRTPSRITPRPPPRPRTPQRGSPDSSSSSSPKTHASMSLSLPGTAGVEPSCAHSSGANSGASGDALSRRQSDRVNAVGSDDTNDGAPGSHGLIFHVYSPTQQAGRQVSPPRVEEDAAAAGVSTMVSASGQLYGMQQLIIRHARMKSTVRD